MSTLLAELDAQPDPEDDRSLSVRTLRDVFEGISVNPGKPEDTYRLAAVQQFELLDDALFYDVYQDLGIYLPSDLNETFGVVDAVRVVEYATAEFPHARQFTRRFDGVADEAIMKGIVESTFKFRVVRNYLRRMHPELWSDKLTPEAKIATLYEVLNLFDVNEQGQGRVALHCTAVDENLSLIGKQVGLSESDIHDARLAAKIHDFGKVGTSPRILNRKQPPLTGAEWAPLFTHPGLMADLVEEMGMSRIAKILRHYHERFAGDGYPRIAELGFDHIDAQLLAAADAITVMNGNDHSHSHKKERSCEEVITKLLEDKGHLAPKIRDAAIAVVRRSYTPLARASSFANSARVIG